MADYKSFKEVFKKIEKATKTSQKQALDRAATSTRALYAKEIGPILGISAKTAKERAKIYKASELRPVTSVSFGTKYGLAAHKFKVTTRVVKTSGGKRKTPFIKSQGGLQSLPKGAFQTNVSSRDSTEKLVLQRTGSARYPLKTVRVDTYLPAVEKLQPELQKHMLESFDRNFNAQLKYNMGK